ncbi:MAG: FlgD immunoglobulin-like domain containing protein [Spirochaetia bacterium]|jgi:flagellar hook assembly protein FlgD/outer membrane protein OmpA-like peptidoglycan-associated protein
MKNTIRILTVAFVLMLSTALGAAAETGFLDFASPQFLGGGAGSTTLETPPGTVLNPAISAGRQRLTLDFSYIALTQFDPSFKFGGHIVNLGVTVPTNVGVLSAASRFATSSIASPGLDWGTLGGLNVSFSKDLFPDFYIGAGLGFEYGTGNTWGLGLDLGFLSLMGDIGFLKDFRWGGVFRNIGRAYLNPSSSSPLGTPPAFTPAVGASFTVIKTSTLSLSFAPDVSFPTLQDLHLNVGMEFGVADIFFVDAAYQFDSRQIFGSDPARQFPFTIGMSLKLNGLGVKTAGQEVTEFKSTIAAAPLADKTWGFGMGVNVPFGVRDVTPPAITLDTQGEKYISPNFDGVKDDLVLPLSITDDRYVKGYKLIITDSSGAAVRTIQNKEDRPENRDVQNLFARLVYVKSGIVIPPTIRWDGMGDAGAVVPDGTYHYHVEAWDDNGNQGKSGTGTVVVKNTPPKITLSAPYLIFSPDGDGNKDTLPVQQAGSHEDTWTGFIQDISGQTVRTFTWTDSEPPAFAWDGKTNTGALAPDGVYSYHVSATDRAGNGAVAQLDNIIIDTRPTPVQLAIDLSYFSPNRDGVKDAVTFALKVPVATGIEKWSLVVSDDKGAARKSFSGVITIPASITWDGHDDSGAVLPEGTYKGTLTVLYVNGKNPTAVSPLVTIKVTPPTAAAKAEYDVFSPSGDSKRNTVAIFQDTSQELFWTGTFKSASGKDLRTLVWRGRADDKFEWDGRGDDGTFLPDGLYTYSLTATDQAGNTGTSSPITVRIDTEKKPVRVSTDLVYFSPFGGGTKTRIRIIPALAVTTGVESSAIRVQRADGGVVRSYAGRSKAPDDVLWDGIDDAGKRVPDGRYTAELQVNYSNGSQPKAVSTPFFVDNHVPQIDVTSDALLFSPTSDSKLPAVTIKQSSSEEDLWEGEMRSSAGQKIRGWFWKGKAAEFAWDGKDDNGNLMPDGYYTYAVKAQTKAGNITTKELRGIQIDTRPTPVYVTVGDNGFSPNGDGFKDDITFTTVLTLKDGVKGWKLSMVDAATGEQKTFTGLAPVPATITWDGKDQGGLKTAPDGLYAAVLQVEYNKGNLATARSAAFRLAVTPPKVELTLGGLPFAPDNASENNELTINLKVDDPVPIESWGISILDPEQHPFTSFAGKGAPSEKIIWNGTSSTGELVQSAEDYPLTFTIKDALGNSTTVQKTIPVDILVIRDGDKLKVRIASITFAANTADYVNVEPDKALKNASTIKRLAEIFKKYGSYKIQIEGHANLVNFDNPGLAKKEQEQELLPLSQQRADAIRSALIAQGIDAGRISTVGVGAAAPVVPFSDLDNRWKNRRVEFVLVRQ